MVRNKTHAALQQQLQHERQMFFREGEDTWREMQLAEIQAEKLLLENQTLKKENETLKKKASTLAAMAEAFQTETRALRKNQPPEPTPENKQEQWDRFWSYTGESGKLVKK